MRDMINNFTPMTTIMDNLKRPVPAQSRAAREAAERRRKIVNASAIRPLDLDNRPRLDLPEVAAEPVKKYPLHEICKHPLDNKIKWVRDPKGLTPKGIKCPHCTPEIELQRKREIGAKNLARLFPDANIPVYVKDWDYENFPKDKSALEHVEQIVQNNLEMAEMGEIGINIYLWSEPGTGKTSIACRACHWYMEGGVPCLHMFARKYFRLIYSNPEIEEAVLTAPVLVFDDLGAEYRNVKNPDWGVGKIFDIVEERRASGLITIITSNIKPMHLAIHYQNKIQDPEVQQQIGRVLRRIDESYEVIEVKPV